jgi:hypothetical protein
MSGLTREAPAAFTLFMNKKNFFLVGLVLVLAWVYVVNFTDWLRPKTIHISHTSRPLRTFRAARAGRAGRAGQSDAATTQLIFNLDDDYELTELKVVSLAALQTNKLAQPVWHLVGDPSSDSIKNFLYGQNIPGMNPAVAGSQAEPLQSGATYRMFITAGKISGQHDIQIGAAPANTATNR